MTSKPPMTMVQILLGRKLAAIPSAGRIIEIVQTCHLRAEGHAGDISDELENLQGQGMSRQGAHWKVKRRLAEERTAHKKWLAPRLLKVLAGALARRDPKPFEDFAKIIRACESNDRLRAAKRQGHFKALNLAKRLVRESRRLHLEKGEALPTVTEGIWPVPITLDEFLKKLGKTAKNNYERSAYRREFPKLGIKFITAKRGRPKRVTRKRRT